MPEFQHLNLVQVVEKKPFIGFGGGPKKAQQTQYNIEHRQEHFDKLTAQLQSVKESWELNLQEREESGLPEISDKKTIPIFLHIDLAKDVESLKSFGIEVISEEEEGFILGANSDDLKTFSDRLEQFLNQSNKKFKDSAAGIFDLITEPTERLKRILSANLLAKWERLQEEREIVVYIAISSYLKIPDYPTQGGNQPDDSYNSSVARWKDRNQEWQVAKDELCMERQTAFENFIRPHNGVFVSLVSQYAEFDDGFGCKIRISGVGLKDLALNFPFIFNILEHDPLLSFQGTTELERLLEIEVAAPDENFPKVCVIDSGIQEGHRLLAPAIDGTLSISYVPNDLDTFDKVSNGGHGTRVAGAVLFPIGLPSNGTHVKAPFWIQNARILDDENLLSSSLNESDLMKMIVDRFKPTRIFNLSVSNGRPENYIHMPLWSATIDKLIWENDILFCIAAGNISQHSNNPEIPGVLNYLTDGVVYPAFLKHGKSKITNPGYSCFALTVGSISDSEFEDEVFKCIGSRDLPSAFSRSGLGLWGMIKPDVVEYGGDFVINKPTGDNVIAHTESSPNLIRSTRDNGPAVGRDVVGTSFTTPKVTHIVASLQNLYPHETTLLYRALVVQSARIPSAAEKIEEFISHYGYGIPNIERAISNSTRRVTLYASGLVNPKNSDLYLVKLPNEITRPGYDYDVLIEITLSFKAEPRITRRKTNSYLSAWLDWETSRKGETQKTFSERILAANNETQEDFEEPNLDEENTDNVDDLKPESFKWTIGSKGKDGELKGVKRQDSTVQKDWCIEKSNQLPKEFLIAVKGHKGWEKNLDKEIPYSIVVSFEVLNTEIEVDIYNLVRIENQVEVESQQEIQITT